MIYSVFCLRIIYGVLVYLKGIINMCGIVGYIGVNKASDILTEGLAKLEYRGYDSAGIAVFNGDEIEIAKAKGRLVNLTDKLE